MICALMMGRAGSVGFPNKNIKKVLGRRLFEYPLLASRNSKNVDKVSAKYGVGNLEAFL